VCIGRAIQAGDEGYEPGQKLIALATEAADTHLILAHGEDQTHN
jgi:hypothetical protein